tara:strand:- start:6841 stop:7221 length:381 start_codon:yes stop_codon:yes gene_type:complete
MVMIEDKVIEKLKEGDWTFADISNVTTLIDKISQDLYSSMGAKEKLDLIWSKEIIEGEYTVQFGQIFQEQVMEALSAKIANIIKVQLETAKVDFNKDSDINEVPKRSVGRQPLKKRPTDEKSNSKK